MPRCVPRMLLCALLFAPVCLALTQEPDPPHADDAAGDPDSRAQLVLDVDGHTAPPVQVVFTSDGKKLVSSAKDKTVQIWDVETGERLRVIHPPIGAGDEGTPHHLVVDPQGKNLAFWVTVKDEFGKPIDSTFVCALDTGRGRRLIATGGPMTFSPDGKVLAIGQGVDVRLVDVATGKQLAEPHKARPQPGGGWSLAFSPDGNTLAVMIGDGKVYLLDGHTLKPGKTLVPPGPLAHGGAARWTDNKTLVAVHNLGGNKHLPMHVWDAERGELKKSHSAVDLKVPTLKAEVAVKIGYYFVPGSTQVFVVTHQPDAYGWAHHGRLFDWATGTPSTVHVVNTALYECNAADISPDGKVAAQGDSDGNAIILWDTRDGHEVRRLKATDRGADGRTVFWPSDTSVAWGMPRRMSGARDKKAEAKEAKAPRSQHELDLITLVPQPLSGDPHKKGWQGLHTTAGKLTVRALGAGSVPPPHPKEKGLKIAPKNVGLGDLGIEITGGPKVPPVVFKTNRPLKAVTFVGPTQVALSVTDSPWLLIIDPKTGKPVHRLDVVRTKIESLAVSPNQHYLLVGSGDQTLTIYNPATNRVLMTIFPSGGDWVAWTPEGYYAGTPAGTRLLGRRINNGHDQLATFYPADRFRTKFRPDVIERVLRTGSVAKALELAKIADEAKGLKTESVPVAVAELLPPRATLTAVETGKSTYKLKASAIAGKGQQPVMALRLMMNGRPMPGSDMLKEFPGGQAKAEAEWTIELPEGKHQFAVLARGADASSVSAVVELEHVDAAKQPALHVMAVGVNNYENAALKLRFAAGDAESIADAFKKAPAEPYRAGTNTLLVDAKARKSAVLDALATLKGEVKPNDLVVFFFAGHGVKDKTGFYLLTVEADTENLAETTLSGAELRKTLGDFPCQVLMLLDACHSGGAVKDFRPVVDDLTRTLTDDECGVAVLSAAMASETAQEKDGHGLFTRALVEALTAAQDVPHNRHNKLVYVHHLHSYVFDEVVRLSEEKQHPFLSLPWIVEPFAVSKVKK